MNEQPKPNKKAPSFYYAMIAMLIPDAAETRLCSQPDDPRA